MSSKTLCSVEGCERSRESKGLCSMHRARLRRTGNLGPAQPVIHRSDSAECRIEGCGVKRHTAMSVCSWHKTHGENEIRPLRLAPGTPEDVRIALSTEITESGCWEWRRALDTSGYGRTTDHTGKTVAAHRASYEFYVGPIPAGLFLDHLCRNPPCVNPDHLEAVTQRVNNMRGEHPLAVLHRLNECKRGHGLIGDNIVWENGGRNRRCRTCRDAKNRAYRAARKVAANA